MPLDFRDAHDLEVMAAAEEIDRAVIINRWSALIREPSGPMLNDRLGAKLILEEIIGPRSADGVIQNLAGAKGEVNDAAIPNLKSRLLAAHLVIPARDQIGLAQHAVEFEPQLAGLNQPAQNRRRAALQELRIPLD